MFINNLSKLSRPVFICAMSALIAATLSTAALAYQPGKNRYGVSAQDTTNNPDRVCVFDLDDTLVPDGSNTKVLDFAKASIKKCADANYGIAFATARTGPLNPSVDNVPKLFKAELGEDYYKKVTENYVVGDYMAVIPTIKDLKGNEKKINPLYISFSVFYMMNTVDNVVYRTVVYNKGDAMNRLMRTFYGFGIGEADVTDANNAFVKDNPAPNKEGLSGCLVLFDDAEHNIMDISNFNQKYRMNFQAVKVDPKIGVTPSDIDNGFELMDKNCKK